VLRKTLGLPLDVGCGMIGSTIENVAQKRGGMYGRLL
jgi:hypothetical protein